MALATLKSRILLSSLWIAREGDTHSTTETVGRASKPPQGDAAWLDFGIIKELEYQTEPIKPTEILAPAGGTLVTYDEIQAGSKATLKLTCSEFNYLHIEHFFFTAKLTADSAQGNPLEGTTKRGWIKFQALDQDVAAGGTPIIIGEIWARVKCGTAIKLAGGDMAELQLEALQLHSIYNTLSF